MRKPIFTLCVIFIVSYGTIFPQGLPYKQLIHKPFLEKREQINELYFYLLALDSIEVWRITREIKDYAEQHNDKSLMMEMDLFRAFFINEELGNHQKSLNLLLDINNRAAQEGIYIIQIRTLNTITRIYWKGRKNYQKAFEYYIQMAQVLEKVPDRELPTKVARLSEIGLAYYYFQNYRKAIYYFKKAAKIQETENNSNDLASTFNCIGLCYQKIGNYSESRYWFGQIETLKNEKVEKTWTPIVTGNIGHNYYLDKKYEKAIPLILIDLNDAVNNSDWGRAAGALMPLAEMAIYNNKITKAKQYLDKAYRYINISGQTERLRLWYPVMSKWYTIRGLPRKSFLYFDSTLIAASAYNEEYNSLKISLANQKIKEQERELFITKLTLQKQEKINARNRLILLLIILLLSSAVLYNIQRKRSLQRKFRLKSAELTLHKTARNLDKAKHNLESFTSRIIEKNKLIKELQSSIESQDHNSEKSELRHMAILTKDDWREFKGLFDKVYPGFELRLKEKYPPITPAMIRFLMLTKLKLSIKEMSVLTGVSDNTIRVASHRTIKLLKLKKNTSIDTFVNSI